MPFPRFAAVLFCLLACQGCGRLDSRRADPPIHVATHEFHYRDGGKSLYFVLDKRPAADDARLASPPQQPSTLMFVIPGSDCTSMRSFLPQYFDGLQARSGAMRIFILQKRFIPLREADGCGDDFMRLDHPSRWVEDQSEFIRQELASAEVNGQAPARVAVVGISEGAEAAAPVAARVRGVTHLALLANGGMDPYEAFRLQAARYGFPGAPGDIERQCPDAAADDMLVAGRYCRYWRELRELRHTDNLLATTLPIFVAMGEADTMVPVESAKFLSNQFLRRGKINLQLHILTGAGHDFSNHGRSYLPYIWESFEDWLKN